MSFLLKKLIDTWNAPTKEDSGMVLQQAPVCPPTPDLSHLTPEEINAIHDVVTRQEEFERQEERRARRLREELDSLHRQIHRKSGVGPLDTKLVDLQLCRLCFKTKFDEGAGRVCSDCEQRVCQQCGAFSRSRGSVRRPKGEGLWRCRLCMARRDVLCRTGGWYHGKPSDSTQELKNRLSISSSPEGDAEKRDITDRQPSIAADGPSSLRQRAESDPLHRMVPSHSTRQASLTDVSRRRSSIIHEAQSGEKKGSDNVDEDKGSLKKLMLERQMSRRRRQEKLQRQRLKTGVRKPPVFDESRGDSADYSDTNSSTFSSFSDSGRSNFSSPTPSPLKVTQQSSVTSKDAGAPRRQSKVDKEVRRQIVATDRKRKTSQETTQRTQPVADQRVKVLQAKTKSPERQILKESGEKSLQKWRQSGFPNTSLILLPSRPPGSTCGIKVTGGVQDGQSDTRALVTWVSSDIKASISEGQEILEWNGRTLRGQTFDFVSSATSHDCPRALLLVNQKNEREESKTVGIGGSSPSQDVENRSLLSQTKTRWMSLLPALQRVLKDPPKQNTELPTTGKSRILPRIPTDSQQESGHGKGELQIKLLWQTESAALSVSVVRARHIVCSDASDPASCRMFAIVNLVPRSGRPSQETDLVASLSSPEWNQTFVLSDVSITEIAIRAVQLTVWCRDDGCAQFKGEVLLGLADTELDNKARWYSLADHDENSSPLPRDRRNSLAANLTANWASNSYKDSPIVCPTVSPEVPAKRNSSPSTGSSNVSPIPFAASQFVSTEFHLSGVSQPDSFTDKVRKKMRKMSKMSPLSFIERKDNAGSDDSMGSEALRRLSSKSEKSGSISKSPNMQKPTYCFNQTLDLLAPPVPPSRTSSCSSLFMSDDDDVLGLYGVSPMTSDRPPPDGDDITSTLGPGQIPPKPSSETTVCGDIRLGFMVTKGQLEVDILCASGLNWDRQTQPPDTFVKTYLVEGKKVIQSKKTHVVKTNADPSYHKKIKYSASNIHGRIMKVVVWKRGSSADKKTCLGETLVRLDVLDLSRSMVAWYKLFKMNSTEYGSEEFLSSW